MRELVVSVHPDDETLGCGGTILKHVAAGREVHWVVVTEAHAPLWTPEVIERKSSEVDLVASTYGIASVSKLGFPTALLDSVPLGELVGALAEAFRRIRPDVVYLTHPGDVHTDHRVAFDAAVSALRSFRTADDGPRRILCYETLSSTDAAPAVAARAFLPQSFVDVTSTLERKIEIMGLYVTEAQDEPLPRAPSSIRALARVRGATVGVQFAEAFSLIRELD